MKSILLLTLAICFSVVSSAQNPVCCEKPAEKATTTFASFADDDAFRNMHPIPGTVDASELKGEMVSYDTPNGETQAYFVAGPEDSRLAVMVVHEWWGLNDHIKQESDRLFEELDGKVHIIAVDMYQGEVATTREMASKLMKSVEADHGLMIVEATQEYLPENTQIATVGWCFGGGWSLQASLALEEKAAGCVMYYGMPELDAGRLEMLQCEVLGLFASNDGWITPEVVGQFADAMETADKALTYKIFENTEHAFANPSRDIYDENAADLANKMTTDFLRSMLLME